MKLTRAASLIEGQPLFLRSDEWDFLLDEFLEQIDITMSVAQFGYFPI